MTPLFDYRMNIDDNYYYISTRKFVVIIMMEATGKGRACIPEGLTKADVLEYTRKYSKFIACSCKCSFSFTNAFVLNSDPGVLSMHTKVSLKSTNNPLL